MRSPTNFIIPFLIGFVVLVFVGAYVINPNYPTHIIAGESSAGTWISGVLLVMSGVLSLVNANRNGWWPWLVVSCFFFLLAVDERFMIHEYFKEQLIFRFRVSNLFVREFPVVAGAAVGVLVAVTLWKHFSPVARRFLVAAAIMGTISVLIDIVDAAVVWEEIAKLTGEILIAISLSLKISQPDIS